MLFVINKLKYDTDKMELVSNKCKYKKLKLLGTSLMSLVDANIYKSEKNNWLLTFKNDYGVVNGISLTLEEVQSYLLTYDIKKYEEIFGELEEA